MVERGHETILRFTVPIRIHPCYSVWFLPFRFFHCIINSVLYRIGEYVGAAFLPYPQTKNKILKSHCLFIRYYVASSNNVLYNWGEGRAYVQFVFISLEMSMLYRDLLDETGWITSQIRKVLESWNLFLVFKWKRMHPVPLCPLKDGSHSHRSIGH